MREVAISTDVQGEPYKIEDLRAELENMKNAGFTHIHWCSEWDGDYIYAESEMDQIREWMDQLGLKAKGIHATKGSRVDDCTRITAHYRKDYTSTIEYNRKAGVELIRNRVDLAAKIGAEEIVLHMYLPFNTFAEDPQYEEVFYQQVFKSLDELQPYCLEKKVRICVENLFEAPAELQIRQFERLFERYPKEFLGMCLDFGHAHMVWKDGGVTLMEHFGERIFAIHMHDNNSEWDAHAIPHDGTICWEKVLKAFKKTAYQLPLTMELMDPGEGQAFLERAYRMGAEITETLENLN